MKHSILALSIVIIAIAYFACKKTNLLADEKLALSATVKETEKIKEWVHLQAIALQDGFVDSLQSNVDWSKSQKIDFANSTTLVTLPILVPIQNSISSPRLFKTTSLTENYLIVSLDKDGAVLQGV